MRPQTRQVNETVDLAKHVIVGDMPLEAEAVEQRLLHHPPLAHHGVSPRFAAKIESAASRRGKRLFQQNRRKPVVEDRGGGLHAWGTPLLRQTPPHCSDTPFSR